MIESIILFVQLLLGVGAFLAWRWLKGLPDAIHDRQSKEFQHQLNQEMEELRSRLVREIELLKISQAQLQTKKVEEFISFGNLQRQFLTDPDLLKKIQSGDREALSSIQKRILDLSTGLFFFASDDTVKIYGRWKSLSNQNKIEGIELLREFGRIMVTLRQDLGQTETVLTEDDFLRLFVTDWHKYETPKA